MKYVAKEGVYYILIPAAAGTVFLLFHIYVLSVFCLCICLLILAFFRKPQRPAEEYPGRIYAPADGRIVYAGREFEKSFFRKEVNRVSIFMSLFNVHINYAPVSGMVEHINYSKGGFRRADITGEKETNENNFIGISGVSGKIGMRQVAGFIARRIVCNCKKGDTVRAGEPLGLIKFGSRVDVYFPQEYEISVKMRAAVTAGRSILGVKK